MTEHLHPDLLQLIRYCQSLFLGKGVSPRGMFAAMVRDRISPGKRGANSVMISPHGEADEVDFLYPQGIYQETEIHGLLGHIDPVGDSPEEMGSTIAEHVRKEQSVVEESRNNFIGCLKIVKKN